MPPVISLKNQYRGINAHLHSQYQAQGGWVGFHTLHLGDLYRALNRHLRPRGYTARLEESVQIRRWGMSPRKPEADVLIYDLTPNRPPNAPVHAAAPASTPAHALQFPLLTALSEEDLSDKPFAALGIYRLEAPHSVQGEPVAWLELLSPSNKGSSDDAELYRFKRVDLLMAGIVVIELDYLHESPPTLPILPRYRPGAPRPMTAAAQALTPHPYRITVIDPRPQIDAGHVWVYPIEVDTPIPTVTMPLMPLSEGDAIAFDFGAVYMQTFEQNFLGESVDYREPPLNFDRYRPADQARILNRMIAVIEAAQAGIDLNTAVVPPLERPLTLAEAQQRLHDLIIEI